MPHTSPPRSRRAWGLLAPLALSTVLVTWLGVSAGPASAQDGAARPARKDSSPKARPKDVTLTPSVRPSRVRAGETVTYTVTARLNPNWHIYTYVRDQQGEGPRNTRFDFFDPAGLTVAGDWTASRPSLRKKEPAFPNLDAVEFYEGEVSWSIPLKVPTDARPGPRTLRCQASYQICDASRCSFPGYWTLPDVVVEVEGDGGAANASKEPAAAHAPEARSVSTANPDLAQPRKKDTPARLKPRTVELAAVVEPADARPGQTVTYKVTAKLNPGWHIYDYAEKLPAEGPRATQFDFFDTSGLILTGEWAADSPPVVKEEPAFNNSKVAFFEDKVTWSRTLKVPAGASAGAHPLRCQIGFQVCNASSCSPPGQWTLPEVVLTVSGSPITAATETPASPPAAARPAATAAATPSADTGGVSGASVASASPAPAPSAPAERPRERAVSEVEQKARQGIVPLMIASALGGLLALVMPCVWPMVPITVNFFVKQGQANKGETTGLAVTYCLSIIGVFTSVGVFCSFFLSATALPRLANNPWLNFFVAGLFLAFGLSLLGLFEIRLPNALLNASARGESRGGLVGVVFMALTLTITSFTCTFPVVGGLLVMASTGQFFYPIVGLATFSTVLALPFFLLALSPGLLSRVPRSGDWMNAVKVVGGLIEIGAAFKFLNTAEIAFVTPENAWFDAQFVLTAWVVLAAVCGFYLLGFFRTDHDHEEIKVGAGRMLAGAGFLGVALFLAPALFGRPPQSQVWDRVVAGFLPPDAHELSASRGVLAQTGGETAGGDAGIIKATSTDPAQAEREEKRFHGVSWGFSYDQALKQARSEGKPVLIDFTGVNCANCRLMESNVLPRPKVVDLLRRFVTVQLYTDFVPIDSITADQRETLARKNQDRQIELTNDNTNPFYVVLTPDGELIGTKGGYNELDVFVRFLNDALMKAGGAGKMVQSDRR